MATDYSSALGLWRLGHQRVQLDGSSGAVWVLGGSVKVTEAASADWRLGGSVQLTAPPLLTEQSALYILMGSADLYDDALTQALVTMGTGGRGVEWGYLQEAAEFETADWAPIAVADGNCGALVPLMERTEVTCTAILTHASRVPRRGDVTAWVDANGTILQGVVLNRRVLYSNSAMTAVVLNMAAYKGLI